jgi:alkylation response protein AidB-like acyl-CoA dehydrogenase
MNFEPTDDRRMLGDSLNRYLGDRWGFEAWKRVAASDAGHDPAIWAGLVELGAVGALFAEESGGFAGGAFDIHAVFHALGRNLVVEPFLGTLLAGRVLAAEGGHETMLASMIDGSEIVTAAFYEPQGRYDIADVTTRAVRDGEGWVLDGAKSVVPSLGLAGTVLVSARIDGDAMATDGIGLFLVPCGAAGVEIRDYGLIDGGRGGDLALRGVRLDADARVGGEAHAAIEDAVSAGIVALAAEAVGAMGFCRDATLDYLRTRVQFGMPIGKFQALQHRMATLAIEIEQAGSAAINAAAALDQPRHARERAISAAKFTIGRVGALVAEESIHLHGGIGMTWELPLPHYAKRLVMIDHMLGDEDHHLGRYIALGAIA